RRVATRYDKLVATPTAPPDDGGGRALYPLTQVGGAPKLNVRFGSDSTKLTRGKGGGDSSGRSRNRGIMRPAIRENACCPSSYRFYAASHQALSVCNFSAVRLVRSGTVAPAGS